MVEGGAWRRRRASVLTFRHVLAAGAAAVAAFALGAGPGAPEPQQQPVAVATPDGARLIDDVYAPPAAGGLRPVAVLVHGGAWEGGAKSFLADEARRLSAAGWVAVNVDYRTSWRRGAPPEEADVEASLRWVAIHLGALRGDPSRVALIGESAGGHLAALAALDGAAHPALTGLRVGAVVSWSGILDLPALAADGAAPGWLRAAAVHLVGCPASACPARWRAASPADQVAGRRPPAMLLVNSLSEIVPASEARTMEARLRAAGGAVRVDLLPGSRHAVGYADSVWEQTADFLGDALRVRAPAGAPGGPLRSPAAALIAAAAVAAAGAARAGAAPAARRSAPAPAPAPAPA